MATTAKGGKMTHDEIMALEGDALDYAAAVAQGWEHRCGLWFDDKHTIVEHFFSYCPSTNGAQLLEIMAREHISVTYEAENFWSADNYDVANNYKESVALGKTINEAVLRCYLLSKQSPSQD
jgi:hypothetical protein